MRSDLGSTADTQPHMDTTDDKYTATINECMVTVPQLLQTTWVIPSQMHITTGNTVHYTARCTQAET